MTALILLYSAVLAGTLRAEGGAQWPKKGLPWLRFNSSNFARPWDTGVDPRISIDTGKTIDGYSRLWLGGVLSPVSGEVRFSVEADDGAEVWIGGHLVVDCLPPAKAQSGTHVMEAGRILPIEIRYTQQGGIGYLRLFWSWKGKTRKLVPASAFRHRDSDAKRLGAMKEGKAPTMRPIEDKSSIYLHPDVAKKRRANLTTAPIRVKPGPHLFIDDFLIESASGVERQVNRPKRFLDGPVVTGSKGKGDGCFQPYLEVIRDAETRRFRIWYGLPENAGQSHVATMESKDGIHWIRPHRVLKDPSPIQFGVSVIDEGPGLADASKRFKLGYYGKEPNGGLRIAASPDGLSFTPVLDRPVIRHPHDINNIYRDPIRDRYVAIVSTYITGERWSGLRRVTMYSVSDDLVAWPRPWLVVTPDDRIEEGETQFYAVCGFLARGGLLIGMVKVLHDDFGADPGGPKAGVGWTSLAWSRDGENWTRDREVFFDRHPTKGQWDHAMAWLDCQLPVDDEVYLYYGGYAQGHKTNRFEERQIGLARMQRDRYVARVAGATSGTLRTPPVILDGGAISLNVDASKGQVRVAVVGLDGRPIEGLSFADCRPIKVDSLDAPVQWRGKLAGVKGKPVRLEFTLRNARLFAFDLR